MPVHNSDVAHVLNKMADLLEIEDANPFRVRAYRNAARTVGGLSRSIADMVARGEPLSELQGIGKDLAGKIREFVETGELAQLQELEQRTAPNLDELLKVQGLGPKRVQALFQELGISDLEGLRRAARQHRIKDLEGFGERTEQKILAAVESMHEGEERIKLVVAEEIARSLVAYLDELDAIRQITVAGSFRRRKETVGDLDILVACRKDAAKDVIQRFLDYEDVKEVLSRGTTRSTVILRSGLQVDLRVLPQASYGAALHYFTGSKAHNIAIRKLGVKKNLKISEYGVFDAKDRRVAGKTEAEVYAQVDLPYIEPELREDRGEIEAARNSELPTLVELEDIRGDLHSHTSATDGRYSLEQMVQAARDLGYRYLAISNHSKRLTVARGLDEKRLAEQIAAIDRLNESLEGFRVLKAIELDILENGDLDLPDSILKELDLTICSVHHKFELSRKKQTERILRAMDNPYFNILAHPTGRLIKEREPYDVDVEALLKGARERGCFMELNAQPERLDLNDSDCQMARELGVKIAISTDAHSLDDFNSMRFGVWQARRGWLEAQDVLNTRPWKELQQLLKRS